MKMYTKIILSLVLLWFLLINLVSAQTVAKDGDSITVRYDMLNGYRIEVNTTKSPIWFNVIIENAPAGEYIISIPEDRLYNLICSPGVVTLDRVSSIRLVCIARPARSTVDVTIRRKFGDIVETNIVRFNIITTEVWYETWSGGIEEGYYITNGEYTIKHRPRQLVSQIIIKKGENVIFTGLMFPGQEERITEDLRIKFYGAIDNVTYLKVYTMSDAKFKPVSEKPEVIYNYPECKAEDNFISIKYTEAIIIYTDGKNETIDARNETIKIRRQNISRVICGTVLEFAPIQLPAQQPETVPVFITEPKSTYYVGDTVVINARKEFEIRCTDGTYERTRAFIKVFNEPVTCTVMVDDQVRTFVVRERQATQPQQPEMPTVYVGDARERNIILIIILAVLALAYYIYSRYRKKEPKQKEEEEKEVEYRIKSSLEGEQ
ncbi:MAG: hypothetical protein QXL14_00745 [Candidatus Aenigmatarchaeota archaeon]